ncbi:unnamed protein product [Prorocentrum cordatum]|uniref:Uncharacterized protein n=1 Tax=Prorocentrum cordatum TaxID=2364126 RepID=A0ABN9WZR6_9DINO|nr:unnamed protein product [Polarella glacialis]
MTGPEPCMLACTSSLLVIPVLLFLVEILPEAHGVPAAPAAAPAAAAAAAPSWHSPVPTPVMGLAAALLMLVALASLFRAACTEPGIIPRQDPKRGFAGCGTAPARVEQIVNGVKVSRLHKYLTQSSLSTWLSSYAHKMTRAVNGRGRENHLLRRTRHPARGGDRAGAKATGLIPFGKTGGPVIPDMQGQMFPGQRGAETVARGRAGGGAALCALIGGAGMGDGNARELFARSFARRLAG